MCYWVVIGKNQRVELLWGRYLQDPHAEPPHHSAPKSIEAHRVQRDAEDYAETNCSRQSDSQPCLKSNSIPKVDWRIVHIINDDPYAQGPKLHIPVKCLN